MNTTQIQSRISRCIDLKRMAAEIDKELKMHKEALVNEATGREDDQTPTEGGGWSWRFSDKDGNEVCVSQPASKLKSKLDSEAKGFDKIKEVAGRKFMNLFMQVPAYRPVEEFRVRALAELPQAEAKKLIKLVTTEASPTVSFETAPSKEKA